MSKVLYSQSTQQIYPYPRSDDAPIAGLDPDLLVLTEVPAPPPDYDTETQSITDSWEVDVDSLEYRQVWTITDIIPSPPVPNWLQFYKQLKISATYQNLIGLTVVVPNISGVMAAMGIAIQDGIRDPFDADILPAFQASISGVLAALNAVGQPLTVEQLAEVRGLLDNNGFESVLLQ
jgi:hypothetical protein